MPFGQMVYCKENNGLGGVSEEQSLSSSEIEFSQSLVLEIG